MSKFSMLNGNNVLGGNNTTNESWSKFLAARKAYYDNPSAETGELFWYCQFCSYPNIDSRETSFPYCAGCEREFEWDQLDIRTYSPQRCLSQSEKNTSGGKRKP